MKYIDKLASLRQEMKEKAVDAYIIPSSDPHISEYLPERYKCIAWTSGFTGSAGTLAITQDFAGLWTDSRYFVQANEQLAGTGFELVKLQVQGKAEYATWLAKKLKKGDTVAFDGNLASVAVAQSVQSELEPLGINVNGHLDLLEPIWNNRPELPKEKAYLLDVASTGQSTKDKLAVVKEKLKDKRADLHFVSSLDDLAWILNIRGNDVHCNPVVLGFLLIETDKNTLFIDQEKLSSSDLASLKESGVEVSAYHLAFDAIKQVKGERILLDPKRTCFANYDSVPEGIEIIEDMNPSTLLKSIKNEVEINHTRHAMVKDGVALTKFFKWVEENVGTGELSEISIAEKLQDLRAASEGFVDISFDTIAGYKAHGALPHYKATDTSNSTLSAEGLLLVDSGGQYKDGTTDITRVISLGNITAEEKKDYTIVLKGTIEGSQAIFPVGTKGYSIDAITRRPIWETFRNYGHGTGHGVGYFLNVHEGPQVFNMAAIDIPVEEGMITSIEPGLYREGHYGIRIENLVLSKKVESNQFGEFMDFETLTICYIDTQLVDKSLLDQKHVDWLNKYNAWVYEQLSPKLEEAEKNWLKEKTKGI
ncbi:MULTISPECIES: aminopeptidase P family protein [Sphingobacterium]|uniref:Aminopeptidase n=1 Tax=Sphingobacterium cellulitidis TaxID=1768011 RepID=A0A8H9FYJ4_9SPHI|nr:MULTISPECIES: aminopeptidase P family protein [Sphingobacterium]MBA8985522.1 Xaa-Pro aminopeptidase [Sphingobacterium soli]WFB63943.1 aminopeptidase P family protein [Sphingobacterium sp. WM]GGE09053.1 aminopeptidase [Sphingobacterium soli]